ncbi:MULTISPECIES: chemotaxis protein CheB [Psychrilyobacter]|uniref:protein-glutamate methylesterase n=1 Tax=Psychrilyobacter piezotolerans TaxID=2293438 RepID=A0ABX9KL13_9FUSO|nr:MULTISPECIES: chemotaxis protein CheB [Psychrilyobacter]MCS5422035.1 chemotaxis protein CheB [Psychrilyobacter sp. S5]NDI76353.1 chemotaxis protein CheB [Psychrilyobacter piezotolerans]RDE65951.1 chemotaxis protein CheB [Psychrilyobacter sp. S5]REI43129.1 chemotaxis protein CheB [Psychrilyobacter piezotolerans]
MKYKAIVIGTSAGGIEALKIVLKDLEPTIELPIIIVIHIKERTDGFSKIYENLNKLTIKEAEDKEEIKNGVIYFAPSNYHLSIEDDYTFSLSVEEKVNYSRPSIDILFKSAAEVYTDNLLGIILTGANSDGALGIEKINKLGGKCIVQDSEEAYFDTMPRAALKYVSTCDVMSLDSINRYIKKIGGNNCE